MQEIISFVSSSKLLQNLCTWTTSFTTGNYFMPKKNEQGKKHLQTEKQTFFSTQVFFNMELISKNYENFKQNVVYVCKQT